MKVISKVLTGLAVAGLIAAVAAPAALAQCPTSREFGAQGNNTLTSRVRIDVGTNGFVVDGNELASMWEYGNPASNSGGPHFPPQPPPTNCPAVGNWVLTGGMFLGTEMGIQGFHSSPTCIASGCPPAGASLATVVEDATPDGSDAGFTLWVVQETPAGIRWYDHSTPSGTAGTPQTTITHVFTPYPRVNVTSSSGPPPTTTLTNSYVDLGINVEASANGLPTPDAGNIVSYDIVQAVGTSDPGRARSAWTPVKSVPYTGAAVVGDSVVVACGDSVNDVYLAVGATFDVGVPSLLVGAPTIVECDPNVADPDAPKIERRQRRKPLGRGGR